ncbi:MAG: glycoside hydrolase family 57 [Proteobacteria bacterium]|nr:glycoside hydrolase family 57 [Pseudomonadota bacterium]MBU1456575.1 glycoside hydrolase family 57 [Pseudomonadota bacterium]
MRPKGYLIFHLNLAFSSIAAEDRPDVIRICYHSLLRFIEDTAIPVGVELTGWTLKQIEQIDPAWIKQFKELLKTKQCELIGSGYSQIIAPLVPYEVNIWNQRLGLKEYVRILGGRPDIVLVNEMAYSNSLVELYADFAYQGFIMDRDNVRLALDLDGTPMSAVPTHAQGATDTVLPVLWADSILFQKIQHYAHGDIAKADYLQYLKKRIEDGETLLPIYCNDAEIFDYRPGRFSQERSIHSEGEWNRLHDLLSSVTEETAIEWISPTQALRINNQSIDRKVSRLTSASHPIPVKKQAKYNIARWAITGKNDLWLNTMCHRIAKQLSQAATINEDHWKKLCEFWASDFRTHIEKKRWDTMCKKLNDFLHELNLATSEPTGSNNITMVEQDGFEINRESDNIYLSVKSAQIDLVLNMRRGLAIKSLAFKSHAYKALVGSLPHGYYKSIALGADFYSGNLVAELPTEHTRTTDLEPVIPNFQWTKTGLEISSEIQTKLGVLFKTINVERDSECISISYNFDAKIQKHISSIRTGIMTFLPENFADTVEIITANGGPVQEHFLLDRDFDHSSVASTLVSSNGGFGSTNGEITIQTGHNGLRFSWAPAECACMPLVQHMFCKETKLFRLFFSISETDDTVSCNRDLLPFCLKIQPTNTKCILSQEI